MEPTNNHIAYSKPVRIAVLVLAVILALVGLKGLFWSGHAVKGDDTNRPSIVVAGQAEVYANPDIAMVTFEVRKEAKTVAEAQQMVNTTVADVTTGLKEKGIAEKDIKTQYYNTYPVYDYVSDGVVRCLATICPPVQQEAVIRGYEVSQSIEVKIRAIDTSGEILGFLGEKGVTSVSGVTFTLDDEDGKKAEARQLAIDEAKAKAKVLAKQLDVRLVRIVSFSEDSSPMYAMYQREMSMDAKGGAAPTAVSLPTGENKITSNVTIVYEIR